MKEQTQDIGPWYKQTWLWFVLSPLIAVVIYASVFMYIAITTSDGVVKDDYYRVARGTEVDASREQRAAALGVRGEILIDSLTGDVQVRLDTNTALPDELMLELVHPSHQKYDLSMTLRQVANTGVFSGSLSGMIVGKRYLMLLPPDADWVIRREIYPPYDQRRFTLGDTAGAQ